MTDNHGSDKGRRKASPETIADERIRQERAYQLRLGGRTWQEIAESPHPTDPCRTLYAGPSQARKGCLTAMDRHTGTADTEQLRDLEADRLDQLQQALWAKCLKGDVWAIDRALKIMDQRARLLGLNKPVRQQIEVITESTIDAAIRALTEQLEALEAEGG